MALINFFWIDPTHHNYKKLKNLLNHEMLWPSACRTAMQASLNVLHKMIITTRSNLYPGLCPDTFATTWDTRKRVDIIYLDTDPKRVSYTALEI